MFCVFLIVLMCVDLFMWFCVFGICAQSISIFTYVLFNFCVEFAETNVNVLCVSCFNIFCVQIADLTLSCVSSKQFGSLSFATMCGLVVPIALAHAGCLSKLARLQSSQPSAPAAFRAGAHVEAQDNNGSPT